MAAIRRLLLVGTPNLGTIRAGVTHLQGEEVGLNTIPQEVMATCPGASQMMPHPAVPWPVDGVDCEGVMFDPGDTGVTRSSLLGRRTLDIAAPRSEVESLQVAHSAFLCERHQQLTDNPTFLGNLLNALLSVDAP